MIGGTTNGEPVGFTLADGKIARWPKAAACSRIGRSRRSFGPKPVIFGRFRLSLPWLWATGGYKSPTRRGSFLALFVFARRSRGSRLIARKSNP